MAKLTNREEVLVELESLYNEIKNHRLKHTTGKTLIYLLNVMSVYFKDIENQQGNEDVVQGAIALGKLLKEARERKNKDETGNDDGEI